MANFAQLKAAIQQAVDWNNHNNEISGLDMLGILNTMINSLGAGYMFAGVAKLTPTQTDPGTPDQNVFYIAAEPGTYTNFPISGGYLQVAENEVAIFKYNGQWSKDSTGAASAAQLNQLGQQMIYDVTKNNPTAGPNNDGKFESLSALLSDANLSTLIPIAVRCGGMSIRFVQTSDNKYVQYICNSQIFTTDESDWKKIATQTEIDRLRFDGYTFCGFALKTDIPATLYGNGYYIALQKGVYSNFGNLEVTDNSSLLNLLCWDSYNERWWLNTGITIANNVEDGNPFVVTSQAVYNKITAEITPLKKNKYLSVDNGVYNKLTELYLSGVDKTHSYRLDYFGYNNGIQWAFIIDVNTNTRVAHISDDTLTKDIIPLITDNDSGVSGYIMMNVSQTSSDERVSGSIINLDVATNKANSPCIGSMNPFVASNWNGIGDSIKELYLYGINPIGNYTIKYCGYDPVNNRDCLFIYNSNNTLVAYMLDATRSKGIVPIVSNDSIISGYIIKDFKETATDQRQEAKLNVANASNRAFSPIIDKEESVVIAADGTGDYTSLTEGIKHAVGMRYANVIVKDGTYDIIAEHKALYGNDFFTNYTAAAEANSYKRGIFLKNNINILFSKGAKVLCDNTDGNDASKKDFAPFNSGEYGFTINGLNLYAKCTRYCVHDERNSEEDSYKNHYINCYMELDNSQNDPWSFRGCIGGGLGCYGNIIVENCQFKSADADNRAIVSWHNTAAAKGKSLVVIKDCYFYGLSSVYIHYYGTSTDISTMMVSNCSFGIAPLPVAPEGTATVENVELIAWNNEVRV